MKMERKSGCKENLEKKNKFKVNELIIYIFI